MATERLYQAIFELEIARRELQRWTRAAEAAKRARDMALQEQDRLRVELAQVERSLNQGVGRELTSRIGGSQQVFNVRGQSLKQRRLELLRVLNARPDSGPPPVGRHF